MDSSTPRDQLSLQHPPDIPSPPSCSLLRSSLTPAVGKPHFAPDRTPEPIYPLSFQLGNPSLQTVDQQVMSSDVAANLLFGDLRDSYDKQQARVDILRVAAENLESQFLISVRNRATRPSSSISDEEKSSHDDLRRALNRTRLQLADEVKLLQWLRRRHNMAVIGRKARSRYLVY
ncbi:hypothetical protein GQ54DRAFT_295929 [Martensiomyces pterosporus]|nr:hypothetical protein GQ54DRAFT_295929 [Martensiomyces pterosporus]